MAMVCPAMVCLTTWEKWSVNFRTKIANDEPSLFVSNIKQWGIPGDVDCERA